MTKIYNILVNPIQADQFIYFKLMKEKPWIKFNKNNIQNAKSDSNSTPLLRNRGLSSFNRPFPCLFGDWSYLLIAYRLPQWFRIGQHSINPQVQSTAAQSEIATSLGKMYIWEQNRLRYRRERALWSWLRSGLSVVLLPSFTSYLAPRKKKETLEKHIKETQGRRTLAFCEAGWAATSASPESARRAA